MPDKGCSLATIVCYPFPNRLLIVLVVCLLTGITRAQTLNESVGYPPVKVINVAQGLPQAFVSGIVDDADGFIWISTLEGLVRYDGRQMLPFYHQPSNPHSPLNNTIVRLIKGRPNECWLRYESGEIDRMNTKTGQCEHLPQLMKVIAQLPTVRNLFVDSRGDLWGIVLSRGVFHYDIRSKHVTLYSRSGPNTSWPTPYRSSLLSDTVSAITEDRRGNLWLVTPVGLNKIRLVNKSVQSVRFGTPPASLRTLTTDDNRVLAFVRPNGDILLNTRTTLLFINPTRATIRSLPFISQPTVDIPMLYQHPNGHTYIVAGGTLYSFADKGGVTALWHYSKPKEIKSGSFQPTSLRLDRAGVLWIGAATKGLVRIDLAAAPLFSYLYRTTFCTDAYQDCLSLPLRQFFRWPFQKLELPTSYIFRYTYDRQGNLWMGIDNEVGYYSFRTGRFTPLPPLTPAKSYYKYGFLRGISIDPDGQLWTISNSGSPLLYNPKNRQWNQPFGLINLKANYMLADARALWVTTGANGLLRLDKATHRRQFFRFRAHPTDPTDEQLLDIHQDIAHPDWLWISGYQGLIRFDKRTGRYRRFTTAQGLPNNTVYAILPDRQGYLWLSTNRGLCRFHSVTHTVRNFGLSDGLPGQEFNRFHKLQLPDGRLAFGGLDGWVLFNPAQIRPDTTKPSVVLTGVKVNNEATDSTGQSTKLPQVFTNLTQLVLNHDQNYLIVDFASLLYHQPDQVTYRYQLAGYDDQWNVSAQPTASYTKLPPGQYTLRLNAANGVGQWSQQVRELAILIVPPTWASGWAYALYSILVGVSIYGLMRFQVGRAQERQERRQSEQRAEELRQLNEAKSQFFANVSHELRTPLTLMLGPLSSLLSSHRLEGSEERLVRMVHRNTYQLKGLVDQLLDLNRVEQSHLTLQMRPTLVFSLLDDVIETTMIRANEVGINLALDAQPAQLPSMLLDAGKFTQVVQNLLANALKFTPASGSIRVQVRYQDDRLRVEVQDTGSGIHPSELPHVFERYFQSRQNQAPHAGGMGIGLTLCRELVQLMDGQLTVRSDWGAGTTFLVDLPVILATVLPPDEASTKAFDGAPDGYSDPAPGVSSLASNPAENWMDCILIVEDNNDMRTYLSTLLTPQYTVKTAADGQLALELLNHATQLPSLIIIDIMMPVMDGFHLLEILKAHDHYRSIPVVILTARAELPDRLRALRLGVDDYLIKPFEETELLARLASLLRNWHERLQHRQHDREESGNPDREESPARPLPEADHPVPAISADEIAWLKRLEELVARRLNEFDLTAETLADDMATSRRNFYRLVGRLTGLTPAQYLTEARFQQARTLLETRQVSTVKQVAYRVGFRKISYFAQVFHQRFGKRPTDYLQS